MNYRKAVLILAIFCAFLAAGSTANAQGGGRPNIIRNTGMAATMSSNQQALLSRALDGLSLSSDQKQAATADFAKLPAGAQEAVLCRLSPPYASQLNVPASRGKFIIRIPGDSIKRMAPTINSFYPTKQSPTNWVMVEGYWSNGGSKIFFDGAEAPTYNYLGALIFQVPAGKTLGQSYPVYIKDAGTQLTSDSKQYKVVASLGYRGVNGWKFANFGTSVISWNVFRDYFTPAAVEYSNGAHRYSAQSWYDASYKGVGGGGDCYGMSTRSIRTKLNDWSGISNSWWPSNLQPTVWDYPRLDPQILDCVREDQGGQLARQASQLINYRWNNQNHNMAWEFVRDAIASGDPMRQPVLCMWGPAGGHAVVAYAVQEVGDDRRILVYDNNKPYAENETSDSNSTAHISKSSGSFSYNFFGSQYANKMLAMSYNEMIYSPPMLPSGVGATTGSMGATDTTIAVFDSPTAVKQITDEQGHTFFSGNQANNSATRIPDSMRFIPLTGGPMPADYPAIFIFGKSTGKSLTFDLAQGAPTRARIFSPGRLTELTSQNGRFRLNKIMLPDQELLLTNAAQMNLSGLNVVSIQQDNTERVFQIEGLQATQKGDTGIRLSPTNAGIAITGNSGAKLNLTIRHLSNAGAQQSTLRNITVPANRSGVIDVPNFNNLQNVPLNLQVR